MYKPTKSNNSRFGKRRKGPWINTDPTSFYTTQAQWTPVTAARSFACISTLGFSRFFASPDWYSLRIFWHNDGSCWYSSGRGSWRLYQLASRGWEIFSNFAILKQDFAINIWFNRNRPEVKQVTIWSRTRCLRMHFQEPAKNEKALHIIDT